MTRLCAILALLLASTAVRAEEMKCPSRLDASLVRILYLFSIKDPRTFATCIYSDGADRSIELRAGCRLSPVDLAHDARQGGMHECREKSPDRCHIVCP